MLGGLLSMGKGIDYNPSQKTLNAILEVMKVWLCSSLLFFTGKS
jgi:hypothetical protein